MYLTRCQNQIKMDSNTNQFTFTVQSNLCLQTFPQNTSFHFKNNFPKVQSLAGYEVGIVSAYITDHYQKPSFVPVVKEKVVDKKFFNNYLSDNEIIIQNSTINSVSIILSFKKLANFIDYLNNAFENAQIPCILTPTFIAGKITSMKIAFTPVENFKLSMPVKMCNILGFSSNIFTSGVHESDATVSEDLESFGSDSNQLLGKVTMYRYIQEAVELEQIIGTPTLEELLAEISGELAANNHDMKLLLKPDTDVVEYQVVPKQKRIILSSFLNNYLGLDKNFYFSDAGSFKAPLDILNPGEIDEYLFETPKTSSKLLLLTNLIGSQYYGSDELPILALVDRYSRQNVESSYIMNPIIYKPVVVDQASFVEIQIKSDEKEFIPSHKSPSLITLHFRLSKPL